MTAAPFMCSLAQFETPCCVWMNALDAAGDLPARSLFRRHQTTDAHVSLHGLGERPPVRRLVARERTR